MRDTSMEDAKALRLADGRQVRVLAGNIGCMVNGAGLAMGTMDIIKLKGGDPANFCDLSGVNEAQVSAAFGVVSGDPSVKAILVIARRYRQCDIVAEGIVNACNQIRPAAHRPSRGHQCERAKEIDSTNTLISAENLDDAAKAVAAMAWVCILREHTQRIKD